MARPAAPLLLALLGATAAVQIGKDETDQLQRMVNSPLTQLMAERLNLLLPEVPQFNVDFQDADINALLLQAADLGCVPEVVQVSEEVSATVQGCVAEAYRTAIRIPLAPGRRKRNSNRKRGGRGGRGRSVLDRMWDRAIEKAMVVTKRCVLNGLQLIGSDGELNQTRAEELIDGMIADDEFKSQKKILVDLCITSTPEEINDASQRLKFQVACIGRLSKLECSLGVADTISPTLGLFMRMKEGKCLTKGLEPPARAVMAKTACVSEEVSALMRTRLDETAVSSGRRRRRDVALMAQLQQLASMEGLEKALGAAPPVAHPRCRPSRKKPCRKRRPPPAISVQELNTTLERAEALLGPLDQVFAGLPDQMLSAANCWHYTIGTTDDVGGVDIAALQAVTAEATGPEELKMALDAVISTCDSMGAAATVDGFTECMTDGAPYACGILEVLQGLEEMPARG